MTSIWDFDDAMGMANLDLVGYDVEAVDGTIGTIDEASDRAGSAYLVVDTGFWIFGKKRLIPAGVVQRVSENDRKVYVSLSKDQIKSAPDFKDADRKRRDETYDTYYSPYGR
jgi:hypothetical protein